MISIQQNARKEMLTNEQTSSWKKATNSIQQKGRKETLHGTSWKKAMNSIQQNGKKEMLTDEQASGWKKAMISIQQNGRKEMLYVRTSF